MPTCAFVRTRQTSYRDFSRKNRRYLIILELVILELEIKDITDTARCASYLDLYLKIDSNCRLRTKLYNKRNYFDFPIVNFPFISRNISATHVYGVFISELILYFRAYMVLTTSYLKRLNQGFLYIKLLQF